MCAAAYPSTSSGSGSGSGPNPYYYDSSDDTEDDQSLPLAPKSITEADLNRYKFEKRVSKRRSPQITYSDNYNKYGAQSDMVKEKVNHAEFVKQQNLPNPYYQWINLDLRLKRIKRAFKRGRLIFYVVSWYSHRGETEVDYKIANSLMPEVVKRFYESCIPQEKVKDNASKKTTKKASDPAKEEDPEDIDCLD